MSEHYTKNTISVTAWCNKCNKSTTHRVDVGRKGPCLDCVSKLEENRKNAPAKVSPPQAKLF